MTTPMLAAPVPWGERTELLKKQMGYALSLDLAMKLSGIYLSLDTSLKDVGRLPMEAAGRHRTETPDDVRRAHLVSIWTRNRGLGHLFDDVIVAMPEGLRCDVPTGLVSQGLGQIGDPNEPSSTSLSMRLSADVGSRRQLLIECSGVINFDGGSRALRRENIELLTGNAFIASNYVSSSVTYRWLERRQLFGIGRVRCADVSGERLLTFSFDLYAGA